MINEYRITKNLMKSWAKEYRFGNAASVVLLIIWAVVFVLSLFSTVVNVLYSVDWFTTYVSVLCLIASVYKLFIQRFFIWSKRYKMMSKIYGVEEWTRKTEFLENEIVLTDHNSITKFQYSNIRKIKERDEIVMIFLNHNMALRLYKNAFIQGSWEECKKMLEQKTK